MAVTRIWAVRNNLSQVLDYASNKSKTDLSKYSDLIDALHYAADEEKTNLEKEQKPMCKVPIEKLQKIAPKVKDKDFEDFVLKACEHYYRYLQRQRTRDRDAR